MSTRNNHHRSVMCLGQKNPIVSEKEISIDLGEQTEEDSRRTTKKEKKKGNKLSQSLMLGFGTLYDKNKGKNARSNSNRSKSHLTSYQFIYVGISLASAAQFQVIDKLENIIADDLEFFKLFKAGTNTALENDEDDDQDKRDSFN